MKWVSSWLRAVLVAAVSGTACASHHTTTGLALRVDEPGAIVTISHDPFPGYMDAMAMPFDLRGSARCGRLTAGDRVRFRLAVKGGHSWVDRIESAAQRAGANMAATPEQRPIKRYSASAAGSGWRRPPR